jgi:putative transposase
MKLSFKYRLDLSVEQAEALQKNFNFCRFLYNSALQEKISHYQKFKKSVSYNSQSASLREIKPYFSEQVATIYSQTLQQVLKRLDVAYQNFFRRVKQGETPGFPRYKSMDRLRSICFPQSDLTGGGVKLLENKTLKIYGIPGEVKVKWHRPFQGRCKQVTIVKQSGNYYVVLSCDDVPLEPLPATGKTIAIDLGLDSFATLDDGTKFHHPKPYKTAKEKLAYLNKKLALKQKGSNNRKKVKASLSKAYEKVNNIRNDFQHKLSKKLVIDNDVVIIEKLNIKGMLEAKGFEVSKSNIQNASWGNFVNKLTYKAEKAGRKIILVNPRNTSKMCSGCGTIKKSLALTEREYQCNACGIALDRDVNAARNIRRLGTSLAISNDFRSPSL